MTTMLHILDIAGYVVDLLLILAIWVVIIAKVRECFR